MHSRPLAGSEGQAAKATGARFQLPTIPHVRLRFTLRAERSAALPPYHGSLLRGAFGHALRLAVCAMGPAQSCVTCRLRQACVYTRLFETLIEEEAPPFLRGLNTSPRPYVFEPLSNGNVVAPGGVLEFDLLLIGRAADLQAYVLLAVERMAARGLGRDRHPFALENVRYLDPHGDWRDAYDPRSQAVHTAGARLLPPASGQTPASATLRFLTPTRIKTRDNLAASIEVRPFAFAMVRRILELAHFHVPGATIDWAFRCLLDHASAVHIRASDLRWKDWERYSNRQQAKMNFGGFVGTVEIEGDLEPLWPLLRTAEILHVGKGATFGLGRFELSR